jgi:fatty-acid desaturase
MIVCGAIEAYYIVTDFSNQWLWLPLAIAYTVIVNDVFCHRICSHKMFVVDPTSWTYKFLTWWASADQGYGPVYSITLAHNLHHIHSDQNRLDVMNWRYYWYSDTVVSPLPKFNFPPIDKKYQQKQIYSHREIMHDPWTLFCNRHSVEIALITHVVLFLLAPVFLFKVMYLGRFLLSVMTGLAGFCGHVKKFPGSYRNFDTKDTTSNNLFFHYLFLGMFAGMLQNNHHGKPNAQHPHHRWWEFDSTKPIVFFLRLLLEKKHLKI